MIVVEKVGNFSSFVTCILYLLCTFWTFSIWQVLSCRYWQLTRICLFFYTSYKQLLNVLGIINDFLPWFQTFSTHLIHQLSFNTPVLHMRRNILELLSFSNLSRLLFWTFSTLEPSRSTLERSHIWTFLSCERAKSWFSQTFSGLGQTFCWLSQTLSLLILLMTFLPLISYAF